MIPAALKSELEGAKSLMDRVLRDGDSIAAEFPLVFREGFPGQVVCLGDDDGVRSACTMLTRELISRDVRFRAGLIGSVSTDPEFRREGLATKVLQEAEQRFTEAGAVVSILWADDPRFYFARGYRPAGAEIDFVITDDVVSILPTKNVREANPGADGDAPAIHAAYCEHEARVDRSAEETAVLLECPGMRTLVCEHEGRVTAYACLGRGSDLDRTIHEWGGELSDVLALVRAHAEHCLAETGEPAFLITPSSATELHERLRILGAESSLGLLGLAKIADRGAAAELLAELLGPAAEVTFDPDAEPARSVHLRGPGGEAHLNDDTLLILLLSERGEREDTVNFGRELGLDVDRLPLQPFIWGLDSI